MGFINLIKRFIANRNYKQNEKMNNAYRQFLFDNRRCWLEHNILANKYSGVTNEQYCDHKIIVSLTTFGKRIYDVHLTIESIMEQTMLPNRIILWLDYSFQNRSLPRALQMLQQRGLEIMYCDDIRSYKKLIPTLNLCPNDAIITIDDDVIYEFDLLERLIYAYIENPSYIYCHRYHKMKFVDGKFMPYSKWDKVCSDMTPDVFNFPTGVGGVLYPPHSLDSEVFNQKIFMDICPYADDVWFKAMSVKKGTLVKKVYSHSQLSEDFLLNISVQDESLQIKNVDNCLNDKQLNAVLNHYNLYSCFI